MRLVVVSGLSGAGKTVAMHVLEDLGYYCVDNLPLTLLPALAGELCRDIAGCPERAAVAVDARNTGNAFDRFEAILGEVRAQGVDTRIVFLEAADDVLLRRFSETRRRHPLTVGDVTLAEALGAERALLEPVRDAAALCIDTTGLHLHQLRDLVRQRVDDRPADRLTLVFQSFGFKFGLPQNADFVYDVRCLPNPYWQPALRHLRGRDPAVIEFLEAEPAVQAMRTSIVTFLSQWIPAFQAENRAYLNIAAGCTGGHHRSVYLVEALAAHFRERYPQVVVRHRELG